jgi:hypothetical protein
MNVDKKFIWNLCNKQKLMNWETEKVVASVANYPEGTFQHICLTTSTNIHTTQSIT